MRRIVALVLVSLMPAAPAAAQFEGTVHMKMSGSGSAAAEGMTMRIAIKGDRQATIMAMPPSAGPMAGMEMRSIIDGKANTMTTLMPMPPGMPAMPGMADAKGFKTVTDLSKVSVGAQSDAKVEIKKLGTTQKIAGFDCDDYEITSGTGSITRSCITQSLGRFILPEAGGGMGMGRRGGSAPPPWAKAFGDRAAFPLKVWTTDGKIAMEVTSVEKGPVPESLFEIPDGYMDMGAMMRGRGGI
ncbi:MAG: DUF4412 domain-containing protein [Gemmatimonas sp.]